MAAFSGIAELRISQINCHPELEEELTACLDSWLVSVIFGIRGNKVMHGLGLVFYELLVYGLYRGAVLETLFFVFGMN